jgi:dipeptidyl aminopeptidase/acylaminoacyl peptidase
VPGIVLNRGGNREFGALRGPEIVPFVEAGYATVATQYRGNAGGEGREEFGGADVRDVLNAVKVLQAQQAVDPERIGMVGFSRGGMMTYLALRADGARSRPAVRAAAVVGGVSDLDALVKTRPDMLEVCVELIGAGPVADPEAYAARSVVRWPEAIRAPILILHGELDARVPVEQARWAADRLAAAGKDVTLETFAGGDHALSKHGWGFPAVLAWMERRLGSPGEDLGFVSHREAIEAAWAAWPP